uniref:Uncharacterized protein n=1 Tax=Lactuca sativa TaxID=4236 RepID=A0A9R1XSZ0_LACSA|nr:hypothetical protein LSAT_V11C100032070 [Lactuca sativa]
MPYCKTGKVKVALSHEVDIESDSEVEMEPDSEVESFDVEFEDGVIQEQAQAQPEDDVEFEYQADDVIQEQAQAQAENAIKVQAEVQVEVEDDNQIVVQDQVEEIMQKVPAFQVVVGKRARKPSEKLQNLR